MALDEKLAARVRDALGRRAFEEKRMFGGLTFMVRGHMCLGVLGEELMVRVGPDAHAAALARPHARPMDLTGKPLAGFVFVAPEGFAAAPALASWVASALEFNRTLPAR